MKLPIGFRPVFLGSLSLLFVACGGDDGEYNTLSPPPVVAPLSSGKITGQVFNGKNGDAVFAAKVSASGKSTKTAKDGRYTLSNVALSDRIVVTVSTPGFANQEKITRLSNSSPNANLPVSILPFELTQEFNPNTEQILTVSDTSARVILSARSLVQSNGSIPNGNVTVHLTVIDPTVDIEWMPGDMQTNVNGEVLSSIESFGAILITFTDSKNNKLNLAQGKNATIHIPLADKTGSPPSTLPLYFYNEDNSLWVKEGRATLIPDPAGHYYEGTVSHFSTWSAGTLYSQIQINGCIEDSSSERITGVNIIAVGDNYSSTASTITNSSGHFYIMGKSNSSVLLFGLTAGKKTNTVKLKTTEVDTTIETCLVLPVKDETGDTSISIKLSWGESPLDMDAYFMGPRGIRIRFDFSGSLLNFPFSQLDVDNKDSLGPEIITIFKFPVAGIYRYSVHNYSRTFTTEVTEGITESPTRVELNVNGEITLFTPPPGEENNHLTWHVFEFVVADDGRFSVTPVNTWSDSAP
ncbi:MAG: carboxypeptidase regulatory-like domain-containing protein [Gammaproteobacteria bacterium]|nr:carboxypeptidase regulatory-like domain-containing protein [Gammaproteobacteria bacterium]